MMQIGIIITFYNNAKDINLELFRKYINVAQDILLCFVDNASKDQTLNKLIELKEYNPKKVMVVEIKQKITNQAAKRAGARYMISKFNLKHIGFIDANEKQFVGYDVNTLFKLIANEKDTFINHDKIVKNKDLQKPALYKNMFSILDYVKQLNLNNAIV